MSCVLFFFFLSIKIKIAMVQQDIRFCVINERYLCGRRACEKMFVLDNLIKISVRVCVVGVPGVMDFVAIVSLASFVIAQAMF